MEAMGDVRTVLKDEREAPTPYTLIVALANPAHLEQLLRTARDVARGNDGEIVLVSVVHKPANSPFMLFTGEHIGEAFDDGRRALLDRAASLPLLEDVPVRRHLLVSDDVSDAVLRAVREADADAVLLGWRGRTSASDVVLGTTVDPVVRTAPCDVYVERVGTTADGLERVLFPTVGGSHAEAGAALARAIAAANDATVSVVSYLPPNPDEADRNAARELVEATASSIDDVDVETTVRAVDNVEASLVAAAADHDLVVLGATREGGVFRRRQVVGSVAEAVARQSDPPVVIAKRGDDRSIVDRLLAR